NTEKRNDGVFYVKCYVNSDGINIVASKVNASNVKNYLVYYQTAQSDSVPNIDRTKAHPAFFATAEGNPTYIHLNDFNKIKHWGNDFLIFIEDKRTGNIVSKLYLNLIFPIPEPLFFAIDKGIIAFADQKQ